MPVYYDELIATLLKNPPDPNEPLPVSHHKATVYGTTITFLIISWFAIFTRLWVRYRVMKDPGWDDFVIVLAGIIHTSASICIYLTLGHGFGQHMLYIPPLELQRYFLLYYVEVNFYLTGTTLIKISLLLQYLRIFKSGLMRYTCISLLVLVAIWGLVFSFMGWFPCFPVRGAWQRELNANCYGFGYRDNASFVTIYTFHASSNMAFDLAIFLMPLVLFGAPNLTTKNILAMAGVFTFGAVAVSTSVWRLYSIIVSRAGTYPYLDFTWWSPIMVILSSLEINLAIITASMPVFWPLVEKSFAAIFVSYEVDIREERVIDPKSDYELDRKVSREGSLKSGSGNSVQWLIKDEEVGYDLSKYYTVTTPPAPVDPWTNGWNENRVKTDIKSKPKPKWEL